MSERLFSIIYALIYYPLGMIFTLTNGLRIEGSRRVPRTGPVLLIANHQSYLDIIVCGVASPRQVYFLARQSLWKSRILGWIMDRFGTVPVDTGGFGLRWARGDSEPIKSRKSGHGLPGRRAHSHREALGDQTGSVALDQKGQMPDRAHRHRRCVSDVAAKPEFGPFRAALPEME